MKLIPKKDIYLDYMASTPLLPEVLSEMVKTSQFYANPNSTHTLGQQAGELYEQHLATISKILHCPASALIATSGATESNALALQGVINKAIKTFPKDTKPHVLISAIEHPSVQAIKNYYDESLIDLGVIPVDHRGLIDTKSLADLIRPETILISVMFVNSEIGTIQPINQIRKEIKRYAKRASAKSFDNYPLFHSDASQALLTTEIKLNKLHLDLLTINGHKIYAPKGVGLLYVNPAKRDLIEPIFKSNYEKQTLRPGTPDLMVIAGLARAIQSVDQKRMSFNQKITELHRGFVAELLDMGARLNGIGIDTGYRVPTNVNVTFSNCNHEFLQMQLDAEGIYCATKSACLERGQEGSVVIEQIYNDPESSSEAIRFSFGYDTTKRDLSRVIKAIIRSLEIQNSI